MLKSKTSKISKISNIHQSKLIKPIKPIKPFNPLKPFKARKLLHSTIWHQHLQKQYEWLYIDVQNKTKSSNKNTSEHQFAKLSPQETMPALQDIWHLETVFGDFYLINAAEYLQGLSGIYPYHQDSHTQAWLMLKLQKTLSQHWPLMQIKHLHMVEKMPKDLAVWCLDIHEHFLYLSSTPKVWQTIFKTLNAVEKPCLNVAALPLLQHVLLGQSILPKKDYAKLAIGDIILVQKTYFDVEGNGAFAVGDWQIQIQYHDENQEFYFKQWDATSMKKIENPYEDDEDLDDDLDDDLDGLGFEDDDEDSDNDLEDSEEEFEEDIEDEAEESEENIEEESEEESEDDLDLYEEESEDVDDIDDDILEAPTKKNTTNTTNKVQGFSAQNNIKNNKIDDENDGDEDAEAAENAETTEPASKVLPAFKNVKVLINFSLGQLKMSLNELSALSEGDLLPLNQHTDSPIVTIYANNQAIAEGEIVTVDGQIAVHLIDIFDAN